MFEVGVPSYLDLYIYFMFDKNIHCIWLLFSVTNNEFLQQCPTDRDLQRLSLEYNIDEVRDIIIISGLPNAAWDEIYTSIEFSNEMKKFEGLKKLLGQESHQT